MLIKSDESVISHKVIHFISYYQKFESFHSRDTLCLRVSINRQIMLVGVGLPKQHGRCKERVDYIVSNISSADLETVLQGKGSVNPEQNYIKRRD